jgi:hypothetical protein
MNALSSRIKCAPSLGDGVSNEQCLEKFGSLIQVVRRKPRTHRLYPQRHKAEQASPLTTVKDGLHFLEPRNDDLAYQGREP